MVHLDCAMSVVAGHRSVADDWVVTARLPPLTHVVASEPLNVTAMLDESGIAPFLHSPISIPFLWEITHSGHSISAYSPHSLTPESSTMAGFFGRSGGGSSNSNSNASANRGQGGGSSYGDNSNNANDYSGGQSHNQSSFGSGGGNIYGSDLQGDYNNNQRGGGGGAGYGSNANTGAGSMARSGR